MATWGKLLVFLCTVSPGFCFELGAPTASCYNPLPKHDVMQLLTPSPYVIHLDAQSYSPGQTVTVRVNSTTGDTFRGIVLVAKRVHGDTEEVIGSFPVYPANIRPLSWEASPQGGVNCITHMDASDKREVEVTWKAPSQSVGDVIFSGSIVKEYHTFWLELQSDVLKAQIASQDQPFLATISDSFTPISLEGCGETKGCFLYPDNCKSVASCKYAATYRQSQDKQRLEMELMGETEAYLSFGTSHDKLMGHDVTVSCIEKDGRVSVQNGNNPHLHNMANRRVNMRDIQLTRVDKKLMCRFSKLIEEEYDFRGSSHFHVVRENYSMAGQHYLFLAWGDIYPGTNIMKKHKVLPLVSTGKVNLLETKISSGRTLHQTLQAHAALSIIGWMFLAGTAIILARHYRQVFSGMLCGTITWLQLHRCALYLAVTCSAISIVIIFVYLKAWTLHAVAHAIIGLFAMGMGLFGVLEGLCRPSPASSRRVYFNFIHRFGGVAAYFLAAAAIMLGFACDLVPDDVFKKQTMVVMIWLAVHVGCDVMLERFPWKYEKPKEKEKADGGGMVIQESGPSSSKLPLLIVLVIYLVAMVIFMLASLSILLTA